jgi:hypothetical protein
MKIKVKKYDYVWLEGKLHRSEVEQSNLKRYFNSVIVLLFKLINYKHVTAKDYDDKPMIKEITEIRGLRSCTYIGGGGQVVVCQFMWKFGKYYI